jgi:hypothetical protein
MAKITSLIPSQNFEIIRDRIGEILAEEFANQFALSGNSELNPDIYIERVVPFDKTEIPAINVMLYRGDYANKDMLAVTGNYIYYIDCYTSAHDSKDTRGDLKASVSLQKIIGMCRYILESSQYKTLDYAPPFNCRTAVQSIRIEDKQGGQDATNQVVGRIEFMVSAPEWANLSETVPLSLNSTKVKLYETDKGFVFKSVAA